MSVVAHIDHLLEKHSQIENQIHNAYQSFLPDDIVQSLKKQKLIIKQQIEELKSEELKLKHAA